MPTITMGCKDDYLSIMKCHGYCRLNAICGMIAVSNNVSSTYGIFRIIGNLPLSIYL